MGLEGVVGSEGFEVVGGREQVLDSLDFYKIMLRQLMSRSAESIGRLRLSARSPPSCDAAAAESSEIHGTWK